MRNLVSFRTLIVSCIILSCSLSLAYSTEQDQNAKPPLEQCKQENFYLMLETLQSKYAQEKGGPEKIRTAGSLGLTLFQMHRPALAEPYLLEAFEGAMDSIDRARYAIDLANLYVSVKKTAEAKRYYAQALIFAPDNLSIALSVGLNQFKLLTKSEQLAELSRLPTLLPGIKDPSTRAHFQFNLGVRAKSVGPLGAALAYQSFEAARAAAEQLHEHRLYLEALDQLAQMYEEQNRLAEALYLSDLAVLAPKTVESHDQFINLEWRRGRLLRQQGKFDLAILAYQRAVDHIEAIRQDIPVEYEDGRSSFRDTLEPIYLGLADLLLQQSISLKGKELETQLRRARGTVELIKQTELQDFLGNRCAIDAIRKRGKEISIAPGTAVLYPIILPDRLELLIETSTGLHRESFTMAASELRRDVLSFASALRELKPYERLAKKLYTSLLTPVEALFELEQINTIVVVPDGVLRLLPFGALHDGQRFAIQKYAIALIPGLSMTNTEAYNGSKQNNKTLLAGLSQPGNVVEKLPAYMVEQLLAVDNLNSQGAGRKISRSAFMRGLQKGELSDASTAISITKNELAPQVLHTSERNLQLQNMLALSGVDEEIKVLGKVALGQTLLNKAFSVNAFSEQVKRGEYSIIHIASHGVFGGTADTTFIMAHDDLITIDKLQGFLRDGGMRKHPIELLTLSACETAEGDDRAPLGLSGAALKARAKSALGSLWPVSDDAATQLMLEFYTQLPKAGISKAKALQQAQLRLIADNNFKHPFFWAPFVMVGSWL